mgnify:CR=1 FL=1
MIAVKIDPKCKTANVYGLEVIEAGWLGFTFAKYHADLVTAGWVLCYYSSRSEKVGDVPTGRDNGPFLVPVLGEAVSDAIARAIREVPSEMPLPTREPLQ